MEFRDLKKQYQLHKEQIEAAMQQVILSSGFISGRQVGMLEEDLKEYTGAKYCISCANGTDALQLALMTWGIGKGDAVFVPDFTFFSSGEVVSLAGAVPIFVDIEENTYNISPESLKQAILHVRQHTDLTPKAVIAVDLFGLPADYTEIRRITDKYHLLLLEDGAQGFGGSLDGQKACSFGDISTTSFFPAKPLGCYGDGGAIFTDNEEWAKMLRSLCVHGKGQDKYDNVRIGMNSRLDTLQAAVLIEKLKFFEEERRKCDAVADRYTQLLKDLVKTPVVASNMASGWAQYTICLEDRKQREYVMQELKEKGIPTAIYYKKPMHQQKAFEEIADVQVECPVTDRICETCLSLPMHAYLSFDEIEMICRTLADSIR